MSKHRVRRRTRHTPAPKPKPSFTEETRATCWTALTELADELHVLDDYLEPSHEGPQLSQMSDDTNVAMSQLMARERSERFGYGRKETGPRDPWALDVIYPIGSSQPAGRLVSLDAAAHAHTQLIALERRIIRRLVVCPIHGTEIEAAQRALRIRDWLHLVQGAELLADVDTTVHRLLRYVTHAIDGDPSTKLAAPCPYCHRHTLVAYPRRGIIRCDRRTGQTCRCPAEDGCAECGHGRRHTWRRDEGRWRALASLLEERARERARAIATIQAVGLTRLGHWRLALTVLPQGEDS